MEMKFSHETITVHDSTLSNDINLPLVTHVGIYLLTRHALDSENMFFHMYIHIFLSITE